MANAIKVFKPINLCRTRPELPKRKAREQLSQASLPPKRRSRRRRGRLDRQVQRRPSRPGKNARPDEKQNRQSHLRTRLRPSQPTKKFVSALISFPSGGADLTCRVTPVPIGWKQSGNFSPKLGHADVRVGVSPAVGIGLPESVRGDYSCRDSISGRHCLILSSSRFIAKGFAINPATPGSFNSS